jgi:GMP reductase
MPTILPTKSMVDVSKTALHFQNIILKHKKCIVRSRSECDISSEIAGKKIRIPVFPSNMKSVVNLDVCKQFDDAGWFHVFPRVDEDAILPYIIKANEQNWNFVSISVGIKPIFMEILKTVKERGYRLDSVEIDLALGYTDAITPIIQFLRENFGNINIIAGNGDSPEFIQFLAENDVDIAKVGIGVSWGACRTRQFTGFASSTITDLYNCYESSLRYPRKNGKLVKILVDGGITVKRGIIHIGDIAKSIAFGASYIQSGALFSECIDSLSQKNGYFGNTAIEAKKEVKHIEGARVDVKNNGLTIKQMMSVIEDSLRSSVSYSGGRDLGSLLGVDYQVVF